MQASKRGTQPAVLPNHDNYEPQNWPARLTWQFLGFSGHVNILKVTDSFWLDSRFIQQEENLARNRSY